MHLSAVEGSGSRGEDSPHVRHCPKHKYKHETREARGGESRAGREDGELRRHCIALLWLERRECAYAATERSGRPGASARSGVWRCGGDEAPSARPSVYLLLPSMPLCISAVESK